MLTANSAGDHYWSLTLLKPGMRPGLREDVLSCPLKPGVRPRQDIHRVEKGRIKSRSIAHKN